MVTTNLGNCMEVKDGALRFKRGLYETIDQEGLSFYGTPEELKPLEVAMQAYFKEDTPIEKT